MAFAGGDSAPVGASSHRRKSATCRTTSIFGGQQYTQTSFFPPTYSRLRRMRATSNQRFLMSTKSFPTSLMVHVVLTPRRGGGGRPPLGPPQTSAADDGVEPEPDRGGVQRRPVTVRGRRGSKKAGWGGTRPGATGRGAVTGDGDRNGAGRESDGAGRGAPTAAPGEAPIAVPGAGRGTGRSNATPPIRRWGGGGRDDPPRHLERVTGIASDSLAASSCGRARRAVRDHRATVATPALPYPHSASPNGRCARHARRRHPRVATLAASVPALVLGCGASHRDAEDSCGALDGACGSVCGTPIVLCRYLVFFGLRREGRDRLSQAARVSQAQGARCPALPPPLATARRRHRSSRWPRGSRPSPRGDAIPTQCRHDLL